MSYLVLARKYRPQTFEEVVGQEHVTETLINAINADRVAHAILFAGPRGTGKTTVARVLAKTMNCENGPAPMPCNLCRSCREITDGRSVDVFEIDGASNNSVEQVRELRDHIVYMPALSRYKIYIIDEVHMLSKPAFNALLKTLEEPPAHILFMFATTEVQKIPITILSRCQRHDLRRISMPVIIEHMEQICAREEIGMPAESLNLIAKEAGGSMRDALSLLDQIISGRQGEIRHDAVLDMLGIVDRKVLFEIAAALIRADMAKLLEIVHDVYRCGSDIQKLYNDLIAHFRNLMVLKMDATSAKVINLPEDEMHLMREQVRDVPINHLSDLFKLLFDQAGTFRFAANHKLALEMVFFKAIRIKPTLSIDRLIEKLEDLRKTFGKPVMPASVGGGDSNLPPVKKERRETRAAAEAVSAMAEASSSPGEMSGLGRELEAGDSLEDTWNHICERIEAVSPGLSANLAKSTLEEITDKRIAISVNGNDFNLRLVKQPKNRASIEKVCRAYFGKEIQVRLKSGQKVPNNQAQADKTEQTKKAALSHPLVSDAVEIFNGRVVDVKFIQEEKK